MWCRWVLLEFQQRNNEEIDISEIIRNSDGEARDDRRVFLAWDHRRRIGRDDPHVVAKVYAQPGQVTSFPALSRDTGENPAIIAMYRERGTDGSRSTGRTRRNVSVHSYANLPSSTLLDWRLLPIPTAKIRIRMNL